MYADIHICHLLIKQMVCNVRVTPSFQPILLPLLLFVLTPHKGHDCHLEISKGPEHSHALFLTRYRGHDLPLTQPERTLSTFC